MKILNLNIGMLLTIIFLCAFQKSEKIEFSTLAQICGEGWKGKISHFNLEKKSVETSAVVINAICNEKNNEVVLKIKDVSNLDKQDENRLVVNTKRNTINGNKIISILQSKTGVNIVTKMKDKTGLYRVTYTCSPSFFQIKKDVLVDNTKEIYDTLETLTVKK